MLAATKPELKISEIIKKSGETIARVITCDGWTVVVDRYRIFARYGRVGSWDFEGHASSDEALLDYMGVSDRRLLMQAFWID